MRTGHAMIGHLSALTYPAAIRGIERGTLPTDGPVTHSFALRDWRAAFETAESDPTALKVILTP